MKPMNQKKRKTDPKPTEITKTSPKRRKIGTNNDQPKEDKECSLVQSSHSLPLVETLKNIKEKPIGEDKNGLKYYNAEFGGLRVAAKIFPASGDWEIVTLDHPHLLKCLGTEVNDDYKSQVWEYFDYNLTDLERESSKAMNPDEWQVMLLSILRESMKGLDGLMQHSRAHGDLRPENIVLQFRSIHSRENPLGPNSKFHVKLKDYTNIPASTENCKEDMTSLGAIVKQFVRMSAEASDLLRRIDEDWSNDSRITPEEGQRLSNLFQSEFSATPLFFSEHLMNWDPYKGSSFVCEIDKFIEVYFIYVENSSVASSVKSFIEALNRYKVEGGWKKKVDHDFILKKAKKVTNDMVGLIHIIRNMKTHLAVYKPEEREILGKHGCYEYFNETFPGFLIHIYRCFQLHYKRMKKQLHFSDKSFMPYFSKQFIVSPE